LHIWVAELTCGLRPLGRVTRLAGNREVTYALGAAAHLGDDVLDLQRYARLAAVGTVMPPLLEEILAHLIVRQFPLLILHPTNLGMLQQLGVQLDQLLGNGASGCVPLETSEPCEDIAQA
jgi:hypothetical protein